MPHSAVCNRCQDRHTTEGYTHCGACCYRGDSGRDRGHIVCVDCLNHIDLSNNDQCEHCTYCNNCCGCSYCGDCDNLVHRRNTCGYCREHCECVTQAVSADDTPYNTPGSKFTSKRMAGVEWEYNEVYSHTAMQTWARRWSAGIHADGSCGMEAVTPPMAGDHIRACLSELGEIMRDASVDARCSIHVHVDASDIKWHDMYRLLWVYGKIEPILYLIGGQSRINNQYCYPCGTMYAQAMSQVDRKGEVLNVAFSTRDTKRNDGRAVMRGRPGKKYSSRYRGLNLCPWLAGRKANAPDTTIEFRIHRNTQDAERVIAWTHLLVRFVDWVAKATDKEAQSLPASPLRALCTIAPDMKPFILARVKDWRKATECGKRVPRRIRGWSKGHKLECVRSDMRARANNPSHVSSHDPRMELVPGI